jgi:four helix bundle protein
VARDHRKLHAYHLADHLAIEVYRATADFPPVERYGLQCQLRRAAVSVPTNIVEGCARSSTLDCLRFLDVAFGSAREVCYLIDLSARLNLLKNPFARELSAQSGRVAAALAGLTKALRLRPKTAPPQDPGPQDAEPSRP